AMPQPAIAAQILEPLDVELDLAPQVALDDVVAVDHFADLQNLGVGQLRHPSLGWQMHLLHDLLGLLRADAMDVLERDHDALVGRDVDTSDTGHDGCSLLPAQAGHSKNFTTPIARLAINASTTPTPPPGARHRACTFCDWVPGMYGFLPPAST